MYNELDRFDSDLLLGEFTGQIMRNLFIIVAKNSVLRFNGLGGSEMKKIATLVLTVNLFALLAGCAPGTSVQVNTPQSTLQFSAPGPNPMLNQGDASGRVSRAGAGLWHGIIAPITLVISFFNVDVHMYEVHNAGSEYDFGFLLGVILIFSVLSLFIRMRR